MPENSCANTGGGITHGEWDERVQVIRWSICRPRQRQRAREPRRRAGRGMLDLRAPDGDYTALPAMEGRAPGVEIRNGRFVPEATGRAILKAACRCFNAEEGNTLAGKRTFSHVFVDEHEWLQGGTTIEFHLGS